MNGPKTSSSDKTAVRPFRVDVPEAELADLRRRLAQTRLPEKETVADFSQGVPLKTIQQVLRYWQTRLRLAQGRGAAQRRARISSPRSTAWTSTSSTSARSTKMRCR